MTKGFFRIRAAAAIVAAAAGLPLISCSQAAPELIAVSLKLVYRQVNGSVVERLACFALGEDDDGFADIEELRLIDDRAQLYWTLTSSDWLSVQKGGDTWLGSSAIAMPDGAPFPRGRYRAVLLDKGGERTERTVAFEAPLVPARAFPTLSASGDTYAVRSAYPKNLVIAYNASGAALRSVELTALSGKLSDLSLGTTARSIALWAEDEATSVAAFTERVPVE